MDRKPMRGGPNSLRVNGDENAKKSEHQKKKSLGGLVGNSMHVSLRGAGNALIDVSNIAKENAAKGQDVKDSKTDSADANALALARPAMRSNALAFLNQPVVVTQPTQASKFTVPLRRNNVVVFNDADQAHGSDPESSNLAVNSKKPTSQKPTLGDYFEQGQAMEESYHTAPLRVQQMVQEEELVTEAGEARVYQKYLIALQDLADKHAGEAWDNQSQGNSTSRSMELPGDNTTIAVPHLTAEDFAELRAAERFVMANRCIIDMEDDLWDITMVAEYSEDIFEYMRQQEHEYLVPGDYMCIQDDIDWKMRSILIEWIVLIHQRFGFLPETLFLIVNIIDRFLAVKQVSSNKLQLVGATAIFIAAKYEEINCPSVNEVVFMTDQGYAAEEILKAERYMLTMLQFNLGAPGPLSFLRRISKADEYDLCTRSMAKYFIEITIMDERWLSSPPSLIAAAAHSLARIVLYRGDWSLEHIHYSGYTYRQIAPLVAMMLNTCQNYQQHHPVIFEKFTSRCYQRASTTVQTELAKGIFIPGQGQFGIYGPSDSIGGTSDNERRDDEDQDRIALRA